MFALFLVCCSPNLEQWPLDGNFRRGKRASPQSTINRNLWTGFRCFGESVKEGKEGERTCGKRFSLSGSFQELMPQTSLHTLLDFYSPLVCFSGYPAFSLFSYVLDSYNIPHSSLSFSLVVFSCELPGLSFSSVHVAWVSADNPTQVQSLLFLRLLILCFCWCCHPRVRISP